jgi:hypothetical protein
MMVPEHDHGINHIQDRGHHASGMGLGIILLDDTFPAFPGDVRNPSAYPYPIQYEIAEGLSIAELVLDPDKDKYLDGIIRAARKLEKMGCKAILGECGYFAWFQQEVADAVNVPVFLSSLLQVGWAQQLIGRNKVVGLLMSMKKSLMDRHLRGAGIDPASNLVVGGAMDGGRCRQFYNLWSCEGERPAVPFALYQEAERDFVAIGLEFQQAHPSMGAMVLECTGFPPFARALQRAIGIPVFSWGTLMDFAWSVIVHRDYYGHV